MASSFNLETEPIRVERVRAPSIACGSDGIRATWAEMDWDVRSGQLAVGSIACNPQTCTATTAVIDPGPHAYAGPRATVIRDAIAVSWATKYAAFLVVAPAAELAQAVPMRLLPASAPVAMESHGDYAVAIFQRSKRFSALRVEASGGVAAIGFRMQGRD